MPPQQQGWGQQQPGWGQQQPWAPPAPKSQSSSSRPFLIILLIILLIGLGGLIYWQFGDQLLGFLNSSTGGTTPTTTVDTTKPVITFPIDPVVSTVSAKIAWHTDELSSSQIQYGTSETYDTVEPTQPADDPTSGQLLGVVDHIVDLSGLQPNTTYHYRVKSKDAAGNEAVSEDRTFTTASPEST